MKISTYIQNNLKINSDAGDDCIKTLLQSEVDVTFWGGRLVRVEGYEGTIALDTFAQDFFNEVKNCAYDQDHTPFRIGNRHAGRIMSRKISDLYRGSDEILAQKNWFTRLCHWARSFFSLSSWNSKYDYRATIEHKDAMFHCFAFSKKQFQKTFDVSACDEEGRTCDTVVVTLWETRAHILYVPIESLRQKFFK